MIIALATPHVASSLNDGLDRVKQLLSEAAAQQAEIVCFPEAYLPGLRGLDFEVPHFDENDQRRILKAVAHWSSSFKIATIFGMERLTTSGRQIVAVVIDAQGEILGYQTKNQLDQVKISFMCLEIEDKYSK